MQRIFLSFLFLYFFSQLLAQEFAPVGAVWYYEQRFPFSPGESYYKIECESEIDFLGKKCKQLKFSSIPFCYYWGISDIIYQDQSSIYFYDKLLNQFQLLFNFDLKVGERFYQYFLNSKGNIDTSYVEIDSIEFVNFAGQRLKSMDITRGFVNNGEEKNTSNSTVLERIGDYTFLLNMYNDPEFFICDAPYSTGLRCYKDATIDYYSLRYPCDYSTVSTKDIAQEDLRIVPNPTTNHFRFYPSVELKQLEIRTIQGEFVRSEYSLSSNEIDVSYLSPGVYTVKAQDKQNKVYFSKLIKL
ncbi:MAG TPA: T9SS type A sorting domain-containing protein [Saprospiraceae bacterium]|nr:T9SS type A sorting domain-containing protein [Saprospiraceae bacterium]